MIYFSLDLLKIDTYLHCFAYAGLGIRKGKAGYFSVIV